MQYKTYPAPAALKSYVRYFWSCDSFDEQAPKVRIKSFADRFPRLVYQNLHEFDPLRNAQGRDVPYCYVCGVDTQHTETSMGGRFSHFGVSFYPNAMHAFFKISANELVNETVEMNLFSKTGIHIKLDNAASHYERIEILSRYLYDKLFYANKEESLIRGMMACDELNSETNLFALQKKYKISERQLERKFKSTVGVSPKKLQRIIRFEEALNRLSSADYKQLGAIAYALNYSDQSHFNKDFKSFSGMTPLEFIKTGNVGGDSSSFIYTGD
ncbi:MAG: helix-turn-helix domain-containing protein [Bacteroidota bacterium]